MKQLTGLEMLLRLKHMRESNYPNYSKFLRARVRACGYMTTKPDGKRSYDYITFERNLRQAISEHEEANQRLDLKRRWTVLPSTFAGRAGRLVNEAFGK